jgi:hypothetical protein
MAKRKSNGAVDSNAGEQSDNASARLLEDYLDALNAVRSSGSGVPETSCYPALSNLFNAAGKTLKPRVRCIIHTKNQGANCSPPNSFKVFRFKVCKATVKWM